MVTTRVTNVNQDTFDADVLKVRGRIFKRRGL